MRKQVFSLLVNNNAGLLSRVANYSDEDTVLTVSQRELQRMNGLQDLRLFKRG